MEREFGISSFIYILMLIWFVIGSLASAGKPRIFRDVHGLELPDASNYIKATLSLVFILGVIICCAKPEFTPDNDQYRYWFEKKGYKDSVEPTFVLFAAILPSYEWLIALYAILSVGINIIAIRYLSPNIWTSLLIWFSLWFVMHDMIQIRAAVASATCFSALIFMQGRRPVWYFILITFAMMFHYSALLFYPIYFISINKSHRNLYYAIVIASFILYFAGVGLGHLISYVPIPQVQAYAEAYIENDHYFFNGLGITWFVRFAMALLMVVKSESILERYPYAVVMIKIYVISLLCSVLFMDVPVMSGRLSEFLGCANIFAFAMFPLCIPKMRHMLNIIVVILMCYLSVYSLDHITIKDNMDRIERGVN